MTSFLTRLKDNPFVRMSVDFLFARGDFVRPITQAPVIIDFIGKQPLGNVLDNGCGRGMYTYYLLKLANRYDGIDLRQDNIAVLQRRMIRYLDKASFQVASSTFLPFDANTFDFVLFSEVLEHIEDHERAVYEVNRVLKPGGRMVISVPVPPAPFVDTEHVREGYTINEIRQLFEPKGFNILRYEYCMYNISKTIIRTSSYFQSCLGISYLPGIIKMPLYLESLLNIKPGLPYDIVVEMVKN